MQVIVNGDFVEVQSEELEAVLQELGYECKKVVVAINETFVPKTEWSTRSVLPKDRVEVLSAMQGG